MNTGVDAGLIAGILLLLCMWLGRFYPMATLETQIIEAENGEVARWYYVTKKGESGPSYICVQPYGKRVKRGPHPEFSGLPWNGQIIGKTSRLAQYYTLNEGWSINLSEYDVEFMALPRKTSSWGWAYQEAKLHARKK